MLRFISIVFTVLLVCFYSSAAFCAESSSQTERLIGSSTSHFSSKLDDLSGRIAALEKQNRLQEDQIRRLDRSVDDLKRRR